MTHPFVQHCCDVLETMPGLLNAWLLELPEEIIHQNEGGDTWTPYDIVGHLIHNEKTDWLPRIRKILGDEKGKKFEAFDRFAQFENSKGKGLVELLGTFASLRSANLREIRKMNLKDEDLQKTGIHPEFGTVTLRQLLATYVVHDQTHIYQIARCISFPLKEEVGPWRNYLKIVNQNYDR